MPEPRGEFERIRDIVAALPGGEGVVVGPGDDAAVLRPRPGHDLVVTTDAFVEGRHFRLDLVTPAQAGARLAAANLSDLAAMAATPRWAVISLAVPEAWPAADAAALEHACARALAAEGAAVVGGNLAATEGPLSAHVTLLGEVPQGRAGTRAGARAGDVLAVTGSPGRAAAVVALALWATPPSLARAPAALVRDFHAPPCRVRAARAMAATGAVRAAIDISDGLAGDLAHLCAAGGVGAAVEERALPRDEALWDAALALAAGVTRDRGALLPADAQGFADLLRFGPGDDYELLLAVDPAAWEACAAAARGAGAPLTAIGAFTAEPGRLELRRADGRGEPLPGSGYDHFS